ncbi:hypothetical protein FIBSPDRAFT_861020, partial [Athelia psychrophila]
MFCLLAVLWPPIYHTSRSCWKGPASRICAIPPCASSMIISRSSSSGSLPGGTSTSGTECRACIMNCELGATEMGAGWFCDAAWVDDLVFEGVGGR